MSVVGTRPNLMKMAPIVAELERRTGAFEHVLVHTGQHYDEAMSEIFFEQLGVRAPDHLLGVGSGSHAEQLSRVIERIAPVLRDEAPDIVLVPGDVNSTLAASLAAQMHGCLIGHVEAGLRSFDRDMPEETNRVLVDAISDLLFVHSPEAVDNLVNEGRVVSDIHDVGNTMIDTLVAMRPRLDGSLCSERFGLEPGSYVLVTLHRPALVDGALLADATAALRDLAGTMPVLFPVHPRTRQALAERGIDAGPVTVSDPLGYLEFLSLVVTAGAVLTDSGGIQEETTVLGVPCCTLRDNTERPVTIHQGTNVLLGLDPARIADVPQLAAEIRGRPSAIPKGWDGHAAERIADVLEGSLSRGVFGPQ